MAKAFADFVGGRGGKIVEGEREEGLHVVETLVYGGRADEGDVAKTLICAVHAVSILAPGIGTTVLYSRPLRHSEVELVESLALHGLERSKLGVLVALLRGFQGGEI